MHLGLSPMIGAKRHLRGGDHGTSSNTRADAIRLSGISVQNCNADKAKQNNNVFRKALENGHKSYNAGTTKPARRAQKIHHSTVNQQLPPPMDKGFEKASPAIINHHMLQRTTVT